MWGDDSAEFWTVDNSGTDDASGGGFDLRAWVNTLATGTAGILGSLKSGQANPKTTPASGSSSMLLIGGAVLAIILIVVLAVRGR